MSKFKVTIPGSKHVIIADNKREAIDQALHKHVRRLNQAMSSEDIYKVPDVAKQMEEDETA
jgi:hypothetical protein